MSMTSEVLEPIGVNVGMLKIAHINKFEISLQTFAFASAADYLAPGLNLNKSLSKEGSLNFIVKVEYNVLKKIICEALREELK